mmetsp:Transcript_40906/g.108115  ORF Transcript_40906/g.108115 Transcript_40906/m.108115 type:complete len:142 (+) Transcript_40906:2-427(+)
MSRQQAEKRQTLLSSSGWSRARHPAQSRASAMEPPEANVDFSEVFAMDRIGYNGRSLNFCRVFVAIISGMASGILGLTGLVGFIAFFATTLLLSVGLYLSVGCDPHPYFKKPNDIWFEGISQAAMSYILFWTLFYDIVHIY